MDEHRVTSLELVFDLVMVFAITQVNELMARSLDGSGVLRGCLVLAALWWAWAAYAWLTNTLDPEEDAIRLAMFASIGAAAIAALAAPRAFGDDGVTFGVAYFVVRLLHLVLYGIAGRGDRHLAGAVLRITPTAIIGPALLVVAGTVHGAVQLTLWAVALAIDYLGALLGGMRGWRVSPAHFAERHGLVVIIAIGESITAIGVGVGNRSLGAGIVVTALLGIGVAAALWWTYFDWVAIVVRGRLGERDGVERARLARDGYSYLHLPMVGGIVLFSLGLKETLGDLHASLGPVAAVALCGGVALYFLSHVALRLRLGGGLGRGRPVATVLLLALLSFATRVAAVTVLALVFVVCTVLVVYEVLMWREQRASIRLERDG